LTAEHLVSTTLLFLYRVPIRGKTFIVSTLQGGSSIKALVSGSFCSPFKSAVSEARGWLGAEEVSDAE